MEGLTRELKPVLDERLTREQQEASLIFYGTLCDLLMEIFGYLPAEEQSRILVLCQTWLDVGLLEGRAPQKLVEILDAVKGEVESVPVPDWVSNRSAD